MTTKNYFETELGFQLTAHEANNILIALSRFVICCKENGYPYSMKDFDTVLKKVESQLQKYENL